jgi:hypothetical protein
VETATWRCVRAHALSGADLARQDRRILLRLSYEPSADLATALPFSRGD